MQSNKQKNAQKRGFAEEQSPVKIVKKGVGGEGERKKEEKNEKSLKKVLTKGVRSGILTYVA